MSEYRYRLGILRERARVLREVLPTVFYAMKANGHPDVVRTLAQECAGIDVASQGELELALSAGARRVVCSGPGKSPSFLRAAADAGATINVESLTELHRLGSLGLPARITLRVSLPVTVAGTHDMTGRQFGFEPSQVDEAVALARTLPHLDLVGWHLHSMSNCLDIEAYNNFIAASLAWALAQDLDLRLVNLGGGFGVDYVGSEVFDPRLLRVGAPAGVEVMFEPGRWLTAPAGSYAAEVVDLKQRQGRWYAVINGGMHQFRTPVAYGQSFPFTIEARHDWLHDWPRPTVRDVEVVVVGELCTPNDVLSRKQHVAELRVGDLVVFGNAGAYGWDISPHQYLRHPSPRFVILS